MYRVPSDVALKLIDGALEAMRMQMPKSKQTKRAGDARETVDLASAGKEEQVKQTIDVFRRIAAQRKK